MAFKDETATELVAEFEELLDKKNGTVQFMLISENRLLGDDGLSIMRRGNYKLWLNWTIWAIKELEAAGIEIDQEMKKEFNLSSEYEARVDLDLASGKSAKDFWASPEDK